MANDVRHANCPLQDDLEFTLTPLNNVQKNTYNIRDGSSLSLTRPARLVYQTESGHGLTRPARVIKMLKLKQLNTYRT